MRVFKNREGTIVLIDDHGNAIVGEYDHTVRGKEHEELEDKHRHTDTHILEQQWGMFNTVNWHYDVYKSKDYIFEIFDTKKEVYEIKKTTKSSEKALLREGFTEREKYKDDVKLGKVYEKEGQ